MSAHSVVPRHHEQQVQQIQNTVEEVVNNPAQQVKQPSMYDMAYENRWLVAGVVFIILVLVFILWWMRGGKEGNDVKPNNSRRKGGGNGDGEDGNEDGDSNGNNGSKDEGNSNNDGSNSEGNSNTSQQPAQQTTQQPQTTQQSPPTQQTQQSPQQPQQQSLQQPSQPQQQPQQQSLQQPQPSQGLMTALHEVTETPMAPNTKTEEDIMLLMEEEAPVDHIVQEQPTQCTEYTGAGLQCRNKPRSGGKCHIHGG